MPFPARLCIRVNSHSQFDAVPPSADLSSPLLSVTKPLGCFARANSPSLRSGRQILNLREFQTKATEVFAEPIRIV
jgi:hypothetical protein